MADNSNSFAYTHFKEGPHFIVRSLKAVSSPLLVLKNLIIIMLMLHCFVYSEIKSTAVKGHYNMRLFRQPPTKFTV